MITQEEIQRYIAQIPPAPAILKETLADVKAGELVKAAKCAEQDAALKSYLKTLVNRPIYGFKTEVSDLNQIFGILGTSGAQQVLFNYMLSLLSPDKWELFKLDASHFYELQASLSRKWQQILKHEGISDNDIESAVTLLPASIIVCEALFKEKQSEVTLLRSAKALDYNTILKRLSGMDLFDICHTIAKNWEMPPAIAAIVLAASGIRSCENAEHERLGKWMHMLFFFELSQSAFVEAGLNDFIDFQIEFVSDIQEEFMEMFTIA